MDVTKAIKEIAIIFNPSFAFFGLSANYLKLIIDLSRSKIHWRARGSRFTDDNEGRKVVVVSALDSGESGGAWVSCGGRREVKFSRNVEN